MESICLSYSMSCIITLSNATNGTVYIFRYERGGKKNKFVICKSEDLHKKHFSLSFSQLKPDRYQFASRISNIRRDTCFFLSQLVWSKFKQTNIGSTQILHELNDSQILLKSFYNFFFLSSSLENTRNQAVLLKSSQLLNCFVTFWLIFFSPVFCRIETFLCIFVICERNLEELKWMI